MKLIVILLSCALALSFSAFPQSATDVLLHQKFNFTANREINLDDIDINDIDSIVQTDKFVWFLMKRNINDKTSTTPITTECDGALKFAGNLFEKYLDIQYTIPVCLTYKNLR